MPNALYNDQVRPEAAPAEEEKPQAQEVFPGELMNLTVDQKRKLRSLCKTAIDQWRDNTSEHMENLRRWNDLYEGVKEDTDWPWPGASNLHYPLIPIHLHALHSVICRSMTTPTPLWYGSSLDQETRALIPDVEEFLDDKAKSELNTVHAVRQVVLTAGRDSVGFTKTTWVEDTKTVLDVVWIENPAEFTAEFPDPESAGMTPEKYAQERQRCSTATPEEPVDIYVETERPIYTGPWTDVIEEADMIRAPVTASELSECWAYGHGFYRTAAQLRKSAKKGDLWKESVERLLKKSKNSEPDPWRAAKNEIDGISEEASKRSGMHRLYELIVLCDLNGDGVEREYICTVSDNAEILLGTVQYYFRTDIWLAWRYLKRPGRMLGISIPGLLEDINAETDASLNQEINSGTIDSVPVFVGRKGAKTDLDEAGLFDLEGFFKPGAVALIEKPEDFKALDVKGSDKTASSNRRQELLRVAELLIGPSQMISGRESQVDPDAPGNKTIALIQQSNMRIEDYINELRIPFDKLGEIHLALYYQFGTPEIGYEAESVNENGRRGVKTMRRKSLGKQIKLQTHGVTPTMNPQIEGTEAMKWLAILGQHPLIANDKMRQRNLLDWATMKGRLEIRRDVVPTREEIEGVEQAEMEAEIKQKLILELQAKGILPPPPPVQAVGPAAQASGALPPVTLPGAPAGAPGLPPVNNLPPGV